MSVPIALSPTLAASLPATAPQAVPSARGTSSPQDLESLRALVSQAAGPSPLHAPEAPPLVGATQSAERQTLGDSILSGMAKFNSGYQDSLESINQRLEHIADTGPLSLGENFGEVLALQIEVARWSMSVMQVDNAAKAGTNTVKELSRGG